MAVEFSRRPLLSLQLSPWLSIFNLNSSCNWLEGQEGGTLLVGCAVPHGSQCAGSPLPLKKHFAAMQRFAPAFDALYSYIFIAPSRIEQYTPGRIFSKAFWEITRAVTRCSSTLLQWNLCCLDDIAILKEAKTCPFQRHDRMNCLNNVCVVQTDLFRQVSWRGKDKEIYIF